MNTILVKKIFMILAATFLLFELVVEGGYKDVINVFIHVLFSGLLFIAALYKEEKTECGSGTPLYIEKKADVILLCRDFKLSNQISLEQRDMAIRNAKIGLLDTIPEDCFDITVEPVIDLEALSSHPKFLYKIKLRILKPLS